MAASENIVVTGATGKLGRLVIAELLRIAPRAHVIGLVRKASGAQDLAARGVELREANYDNSASITAALAGADKVLLISSNAVGQRVPQHRNVIDAAKAAGVKLLAYTSILRADTNPMPLAEEHRATEALIRSSGVPSVLLRNGWYSENYTGNVAAVIQSGTVLGAAGDGRISSAARADYAAAAAAVLASDAKSQAGKVYELAGDTAYTLSEFAAEIARQSGKPVLYTNLSAEAYRAALVSVGLPESFARIYADSEATVGSGTLYGASGDLSKLIGRRTTPVVQSIAAALAAPGV